MAYQNGPKGTPAPEPPERCHVAGCEEKVTVLIAVVVTPQGDCKGVQPSSAIESYGAGADWAANMRPGYKFERWIARCAKCYTREQTRRLHPPADVEPTEFKAQLWDKHLARIRNMA